LLDPPLAPSNLVVTMNLPPCPLPQAERSQRNTTLAIVLWKNVFDWTLSMHRNPYHMHMHFRNSFGDFIRRPMALVDTYALSASDLIHEDKVRAGAAPPSLHARVVHSSLRATTTKKKALHNPLLAPP